MTTALQAAVFTLLFAVSALAEPMIAPCPNAGPEGCPKGELASLVANEPPHGQPMSGDALERKTHAIALELRCPVCQGSSVADSPAEMARNMKSSVRDLVAQGYERDQILRIFEHAYGEFIRLEPVADGFNLVVWLGPLVLLLLGLVVVVRVIRPGKQVVPAAAAPAPAPAEGDAELQKYLEQARALAGEDGSSTGGK